MTFDPENSTPPGAKIKVIGVGGGGGNAVNTMIRSGLDGVDFITCNTDVQALRYSLATHKLQIGRELTRGLGAGADPDIGRDAALEDKSEIHNVLRDADMVFITAGMGGGTGTGGAAIVAQIARDLGALTVAVVTKPFTFEGKRRRKQAESGIARLRESVDTLITIPNQRLLQVASPDLSMIDAFKMADEVLVNAVRGISDIINIHGLLNVDFADVKTVMSCMGQALMGIGSGRGEKRAAEAALMAISSPLLEEVDIEGATGILINITGGTRITMHEINEACEVIQEAAHEDANIIFGAVIDEALGDELRVTVIATGFPVDKAEGDSDPSRGKPYPSMVASRLANAAGKATAPSEEASKAPPKAPPASEPAMDIADIPLSPYDDLAFKGLAKDAEAVRPGTVEPPHSKVAPPAVEDIPPSSAVAFESTIPVHQIQDAISARSKPAQPAMTSSYNAASFASSSADEAQELARWTLDFSPTEGMHLIDEIPSLAAPDVANLGFDLNPGEDVISLARDVEEPRAALNVPFIPPSLDTSGEIPVVSAAETSWPLPQMVEPAPPPTTGSPASATASFSDSLESPQAPARKWARDEAIDPAFDLKDDFGSTLASTMAHSSLENTLFDAGLDTPFDPITPVAGALPAILPGDDGAYENQFSELTLRQGATKDEPILPSFQHDPDDLDLSEIDRKIDEALDLAERMRASRMAAESDDLDVPAFLRAGIKDLPLD